MIKSLQLHILLKKTPAALFLCNGIHTQRILLVRLIRKIPNGISDESGMDNLKKDKFKNYQGIIDEDELDEEHGVMSLKKAYDEKFREIKQHEEKVKLKIAAKKFFSPQAQPSTLTVNERHCIKYLHNKDPIQWDIKTLSESFPATPETIKKLLKSKLKITPERAKLIDTKVQKNWELLSEGKLDAEPHVLEHLKKFVNKKNILPDQIEKEVYYLPKIKKEIVWNQGEMNKIIASYENNLKRLAEENNCQAITDGLSEVKDKEKTSPDLVTPYFNLKSTNICGKKDSVRFGEMINTYKKLVTLEELECQVLNKAESREKLNSTEKSILHNKLGIRKEKIQTSNPSVMEKKTESFSAKKEIKGYDEAVGQVGHRMRSVNEDGCSHFKAENKVQRKFDESFKVKNNSMRSRKMEEKEISCNLNYTSSEENTSFGCESDVGKILNELQNKPHLDNKLAKAIEIPETTNITKTSIEAVETKEKKDLNFSIKEKIKRDKAYYDNEVLYIKDTAFWNNKRTSREKALAEFQKRDLDGPVTDEDEKKIPKIFVLNPDPYPERIKIPVNKRGSGLTFRIKDCYYDDDGEFLYRVPGMTK